MNVTVFDYGAGNIHSLEKALMLSGARVSVESDPQRCTSADILVLPGVGGFAQAAGRLAPGLHTLRDAIRAGLPVLGVCLGMQLLFSRSEEGPGDGLAIFEGDVTRLRGDRVPQIGWNILETRDDILLCSSGLTTAYYANSYVCRPADDACVRAWSSHGGDRFAAMVRTASVIGVQFHPEKSSAPGLRFLGAALEDLRA